MRRLGQLNKALITNVSWRFVEDSTNWSTIMKAKYLDNSPFSYHLFSNDLLVGSKIWTNIIRCRGLLREGVRWIVGRGKNIRFWEDNWVGGKPLIYSKFSGLMGKLKAKIGLRVENYIEPKRKWKVLALDNGTQGEVQLLMDLKQLMET